MKFKKRRSRPNVTPDLLDSLHNLWDRFASGCACLDGEYDDPVVNCSSCNEHYARRRRGQTFCDECHSDRKRPVHGLHLAYV